MVIIDNFVLSIKRRYMTKKEVTLSKAVTSKPKVLGLAGTKGSGKDTAASFLLEDGWARISFADPLKDMVAAMFDLKPARFHHPEFKDLKFNEPLVLEEAHAENLINSLNVESYTEAMVTQIYELVSGREIETARELLQFVGTDIIRNCVSNNYWVDRAEDLLSSWLERGVPVVFTDVRFANEAELVKDYGGVIVAILRGKSLSDPIDKHESEVLDFNVDELVRNNGTVDELGIEIRRVVGTPLH